MATKDLIVKESVCKKLKGDTLFEVIGKAKSGATNKDLRKFGVKIKKLANTLILL